MISFPDSQYTLDVYLVVVSYDLISVAVRLFPSLLLMTTHLQKMWYQHMLPSMETDLLGSDVMGAALQPLFFMIEESTDEEYANILFPTLKNVMSIPRSVQVRILADSVYVTTEHESLMLFPVMVFRFRILVVSRERRTRGERHLISGRWKGFLLFCAQQIHVHRRCECQPYSNCVRIYSDVVFRHQ